MNLPCEYPYKPAAVKMIVCAVVAALGGAIFAYQALHNDVGLIINGIIRFDANGATLFYWVMASTCGVGIILGTLGAWLSVANPKVLRLDADTLTLPHGFLLKETAHIQYLSITGISEQQISRQVILSLSTRTGKYSLMASYLPSQESYIAIRTFLASKLKTQ